jgi:hypothetical protein
MASSAADQQAALVKHSQPAFFLVATGWFISVGGLAYMWHLLT